MTAIKVDLCTDDISLSDKILIVDVLYVLREIMRVRLAIEEIENPVTTFFVFDDRILVAIKILPAETKTHLDAPSNRLRLRHGV